MNTKRHKTNTKSAKPPQQDEKWLQRKAKWQQREKQSLSLSVWVSVSVHACKIFQIQIAAIYFIVDYLAFIYYTE